MKSIRGLFAAILFAFASFLPVAGATSFSTDQSDVWSVPGEDGWGFQIVQRDSVIFLTMYVYDLAKQPIWYTATLNNAGGFVWTGDLYLTTGPWLGAVPFNPNAVGYRKVGTIKWTGTTTITGELRYDVDGVAVVKNATRLLLVFDNFSGNFLGAIHQTTAGCQNSSLNGTREDAALISVAQNGQSVAIALAFSLGSSCIYTGTLTQAGQMGSVTGTFACNTGETGLFQFYEMQSNPIAITTRFIANSNTVAGCQYTGYGAGMRVTTF